MTYETEGTEGIEEVRELYKKYMDDNGDEILELKRAIVFVEVPDEDLPHFTD